jgi:16S rRNA (cytidine1402-2'-O)-methyltransferase
MPGTLFVVATPIGNLEDITLRALRVLREVAVVAAEDTRRTGNLLRHYQIATPLISVHEHNEHARLAPILDRLRGGESVALVSDAGTPGISDPGAILVRAAREAGLRVEPIPGPSAITAALSASGLSFQRFAFAGFPPVRAKDRNGWLAWVQSISDIPVVCFEAPHRVARTLRELRALSGERPIILARELTKTHEEWLYGADAVMERGEFVIIIGQTPKIDRLSDVATRVSPDGADPLGTVNDAEIQRLFGEMTESGTGPTRRAVVRSVAVQLGLSVKKVYEALERAKT